MVSMAVIAVYSVKGGVGKTTIAANLAWCSAAISKRQTLLWDLDAAGGAGFLFGIDPPKRKPALSIFSQTKSADELAWASGVENLDILPADESLRGLDSLLVSIGKRKRLAKLASTLSREYDRIVLDCPPVLNELSAQAIRASDIIIVPLPPSPLAFRALDTIVSNLQSSFKNHPPILPVLSMVDMRRTIHREAREAAPDWPVIPMASVVEQMGARREPLGCFAPRSTANQAFAKLWAAIEKKLTKRSKG